MLFQKYLSRHVENWLIIIVIKVSVKEYNPDYLVVCWENVITEYLNALCLSRNILASILNNVAKCSLRITRHQHYINPYTSVLVERCCSCVLWFISFSRLLRYKKHDNHQVSVFGKKCINGALYTYFRLRIFNSTLYYYSSASGLYREKYQECIIICLPKPFVEELSQIYYKTDAS